ncbi:MAG: hypothetical protein A4E74_02009 [Syntrophus sp. PtaB.Bin075]|nr:MAG: hypothetical protein A4E74_02009 [Syntrophus sp. PtaB.Bin075]
MRRHVTVEPTERIRYVYVLRATMTDTIAMPVELDFLAITFCCVIFLYLQMEHQQKMDLVNQDRTGRLCSLVSCCRPLLRISPATSLFNLLISEGYSMIMLDPFTQDKGDFKDNDLACYCFNYTKADIEKDFRDHGHSTILEKIALANRSGECDCARKNPKGR